MSFVGSLLVFIGLFLSLFFEVFILITYFERRGGLKKGPKIELKNFPSVSVIVPCFNEAKTVGKTLDSLLALDYPQDKLAIIAIDDGSTDNTRATLRQYQSKNVSVYHKENGGKHTALNFGLSFVKSDLVGCLDADSYVDSQALKRIVLKFENKETMAVTPAVMVSEPKTVVELIQKVEYAWGVLLRKVLSFLGAVYVTPGPFSIFRTSVFTTLGGYKKAHHTEDFEIALRMHQNHMKIENAHDAFVYTNAPKTLASLITQRTRWSYGFLNNMVDYRSMLFRPKYGSVSMYVLPMAIVSIFSSLFFFFSFLLSTGHKVSELVQHFLAVGISIPTSFSLSWFMLNTSAQTIISVVVLSLVSTLIIASRKLVEGRFYFSKEILYFLALYGLIVPFWLTTAMYKTLGRRKVSWR